MKITVIGTGYVGLVTGTCFAELGNQVICLDNNSSKVEALKRGVIPIYEPGLEDLFHRNIKGGRLQFTDSYEVALEPAEVIFITVGTPDKGNGEADLSAIEAVTQKIGSLIKDYKLVVEKSTVPVETGKWIERTIRIHSHSRVHFDVASNPEFLREGSAVEDFMKPDRIVIGVDSPRAEQLFRKLYEPISAPLIVTDVKTSELIKHASNSFLSTKISFINAISNICERVGADVVKVAEGMGLDQRIGRKFLDAGLGFGGSCFPKDLAAFVYLADKVGYDFKLLKAVQEINKEQQRSVIKKIEEQLWILEGKTVGLLGLAFKPGTDDLRNAPALTIIDHLLENNVNIRTYDPEAMEKAKELYPDITYCSDPYEVAQSCDCLILVTEWNEFKTIDFSQIKAVMKQPILIDGRNLYNPEELSQQGFKYFGMGRKSNQMGAMEWSKPILTQ